MDWTIWNHGQVKWKCNEAQITKAYEGTPIDKLKYYHGNPEIFMEDKFQNQHQWFLMTKVKLYVIEELLQ